MNRHTRAHVRYHWLRIAKKRRNLYRRIWSDSRDYLDTVSLNQHADLSLARRCSCDMCQQRTPNRRAKEKREALARLAEWDLDGLTLADLERMRGGA